MAVLVVMVGGGDKGNDCSTNGSEDGSEAGCSCGGNGRGEGSEGSDGGGVRVSGRYSSNAAVVKAVMMVVVVLAVRAVAVGVWV